MKKLLTIIAATVCVTTMVYAQGSVVFNTSTVGARVLMPDGEMWDGIMWAGQPAGSTAANTPPGSQFLAQLYAGVAGITDSASLVPVGIPVNLRGGSASGYSQITGTTSLGALVDQNVVIPMVPGGQTATIQMRVWFVWTGTGLYAPYNVSGGYYEYNGPNQPGKNQGLFGASNLIQVRLTSPPDTPPDLVGLTGFNLIPVPEPTTWALLGLGAAALWIFRRRN